MASIQSSQVPLVFKVRDAMAAEGLEPGAVEEDEIRLRVYARALEGMQKEALLQYQSGTVWRLVCDEGPYLNGTDLAPAPLAFFTAGVVSSYASQLLVLARQRRVALGRVRLMLDNKFTMEGSALLGTMMGGALPAELLVEHEADAPDDAIAHLLSQAVAASPASALLRRKLENVFSLFNGNRRLEVTRVRAHQTPASLASEALFDRALPAAPESFASDIIRKIDSARVQSGLEGGAGSSLKPEQKRTLHVRGICTIRENGLKEIRVHLFKPIGSVFEFLADDPPPLGGQSRAPCGWGYLSVGVAFCFLTQVGRYAAIRKLRLGGYRVIQDAPFTLPGGASALETHLTLDTQEDDETANEILRMAEQTCFLHASCRSQVDTNIQIERRSATAPAVELM